VGFIRDKGKARAVQQSPETRCSGEGWGFYGCFNSGLGGLFSLAMDSWAFLDELVFLPLIGGGETILRAFCSSALYLSDPVSPLWMQKCRFTALYQNAGITVLSVGDGILTHLP
jgi:hypothetical protein